MPSYYRWRSRSGCYFCFFQQRREWVGLLERHEALFWKAASYERTDPETGENFTWVQGESLRDLAREDRVAEIKREYEERLARTSGCLEKNSCLSQVFDDDSPSCLICHL